MIILWRLELMAHRGVEGTVLGTLFMPYFSGLGNLIFVMVVLQQNGPAEEVAINAWTNNLTNLCLLLALPALIFGITLAPKSQAKQIKRESNIHRLSLVLTLVAMIFFTLAVWALGQDGEIDHFDGYALVGLFLFWQCFHIYEVLKENTQSGKSWHPMIVVDVGLILLGSLLTLFAVDGLVDKILQTNDGFLSSSQLGLLTGWLMVLPNAVLAFYYAGKQQGSVVYSSQVGDGHICIPLCIGLFAIFRPMPLSDLMARGLLLIVAVACVHLLCVVLFKRIPYLIAITLIAIYGCVLFLQLSGDIR